MKKERMSESGFLGLKDEQDLTTKKILKSSNLVNPDSDNMKGWEVKKLGEVCDLKSGTTISPSLERDEGDVLYTKVADMNLPENLLEINTSSRFVNSAEIKQNQIIPEGAIIFPKRGGAIATNKKRKIIKPTIVDLNTMAIIPGKKINKDYFFHWFQLFDLNDISNGANIPQINNYSFDEVYIPYPTSLPEQQRIVAILDEAFAAIAKAKANARQNLQNAKELFESYLQGVFEDKGEGWEEKTLGEIAFVKSGGTPSRAKKEYWVGDIAWYSSGELNDLFTKEPERRINNLAIVNSNAKIFPIGSLLIGMYDTAALKMSILDRDGTFNQAIAGVKPNDKINLTFILHSINSIKPDLLNLRRGVRQKNLSLEKIKNIPIYLPPLKTQQVIVQKLDALNTETKKLESIYQQKINDLEELKKSVLQKAFSGELKTVRGEV